MKDTWMKKGLVVSVILLFIGVSIAPSINFNVVKASNDNDLVEVTTQACGINGFGNTTVKLTRQQYQNLEKYLVDFRARLNKTTTREEAVPLFKEAVVELNKYGLLPKETSVKQAQQLVTRAYQNKNIIMNQKKLLHNHLFAQGNNSNYLCLIAGKTNRTTFENAGSVLFNKIEYSTSNLLLGIFCLYLYRFFTLFCMINPLAVLNRINLGCHWTADPDNNYKASGWVTTIGLLGTKKTDGNLLGALPINGTLYGVSPFPVYEQYPAAVGFIGIKIGFGNNYPEGKEFFYLGSALWVKIGLEPT